MFADAGLGLFSLFRRDIDNLHAVNDSMLEERGRGKEEQFYYRILKAYRLSWYRDKISTE